MKKTASTFKKLTFFAALSLIFGCVFTLYSQEAEIPKSAAKKVKEGIYVHKRWGTNITICSGKDGLLIIDTGYPNSAEYSDSTIRAGFQKPVKYVINTHYHYDHVGGNHLLSNGGALIVAHRNTRVRMMEEWKVPEIPELPDMKYPVILPYEEEYLPDLCFNDSISIHINDELVRCIHIPGGHSDCDVVVEFEDANVIHAGDLFLTNLFPPIEVSTEGYLAAIERIIGMCDENTIVIPGHGPLSNINGLKEYYEMILVASNRINSLKSEGKSLKEVLDSDPLADIGVGESYGLKELFIYCVYINGIQ
jgi:glyoxylase-like metal-dependent hydrolase (beta-lactamase superfamily II)